MSQADLLDQDPVFQLKGSMLAVTILELAHNDLARLERQLADKVAQAPNFFRDTPLVMALDKLPEGPLAVPVKGNPDGETISRCEQPRGEVIYYMRANNTRNLERLRIRTPTFANLAPLLKMLPGCQLADVPVIVLAIDPCISCTER